MFTAVVLDPKHETFIVHITFFSSTLLINADAYPSSRPQIVGLIAEEAPTKVSAEYTNFANGFFPDLASKLPKHIGTNDYAIKLVNANRFIRLSKSLNKYFCFRLRRNPPRPSVNSKKRKNRRLPRHLPRC